MTHRLFIGLRPPAAVRAALLDAMDGIEHARWQSDAQLHVTLRFIGDLPRLQANDLADALSRLYHPRFAVAIGGVGYFERKGRPTALWARVVPSTALTGLKRKLDRCLTAFSVEDEHRKFAPHITLARLNGASGPIGALLAAQSMLRPPPFIADRFTLYASLLGPDGSRYEPVAHYPLG